MIQIRKLKKLKNNFPVLTGNKVLSKKLCDQLIKEIQDSPIFDDTIMGGRSRINKGSKNFKKYLKKSKVSKKIFDQFNSKIFYKKIEKVFNDKFKKGSWSNIFIPKVFNKDKFTPKNKVTSSELQKILGNNYKNPKVNLDMDFSVSKGGYRLKPHRDDITRLFNFLIYLNDIPKKNGGSLTLYKKKSVKELRKSFKRFPNNKELDVIKEFTPKKGTVVFFQSTPNSYHGVKRFKEFRNEKRYFVYGSYALNKPVIWGFKGNKYYPEISHNNKKMLSSFHDSNYLIK
jgi:Rps23 Pro-64 3,4-dihydroxylase Tpa1-like proline 4-hydroxylase